MEHRYEPEFTTGVTAAYDTESGPALGNTGANITITIQHIHQNYIIIVKSLEWEEVPLLRYFENCYSSWWRYMETSKQIIMSKEQMMVMKMLYLDLCRFK